MLRSFQLYKISHNKFIFMNLGNNTECIQCEIVDAIWPLGPL